MRQITDRVIGRNESPGLRRRLILALSIPLIVILCISSLLDYRLARKTSDSAHDQGLSDTVFDLESHIRSRQPSLVLDLSEESEVMLRTNAPDKLYFSIRDSTGRILAGDDDIPVLSMPKGNEIVFLDGTHRGERVRIALHRVEMPASEISITVMETTEKRQLSRQRILTAMLLPNLAVIVATLLAVLFGVRRGLLPLEMVENEIASRSANDLGAIDLEKTPREIQPMLLRLNELFALLREASEAQQRFIADAAHQLRTPLAGLQTQLDLAVSEGVFSQNEERLRNIEEGTERLGRLLGQLLTYARAEASETITERREQVSLDHIAEMSATTYLDVALAKNVDLGFNISPAKVIGLPWLLQEALANLIDNAIRYTPRDGVVTVRCGETTQTAFLEVDDSGPGIPEKYLEQVFERFYRIPGSPSNGCGLGLPIVKEIAELHGAVIRLSTSGSKGLCVRLEFPRH
jgi:two-component system sensor histidine kinase TctE